MGISATADSVVRVEAQIIDTEGMTPWISLRFHLKDHSCSTVFLNTREQAMMAISALESAVHNLPEDSNHD